METSSKVHTNVVIFGGTGQTGKELVKQALQVGYTVRVLARNSEKARDLPEEVDVHIGDATDSNAVSAVLEGQDAVLCAIGGQGLKDSTTRTKTTQTIITQMQKHGVQKLVVCSVVGIGESAAHLGWFSRFFSGMILKHAISDHQKQEQLINESGLDSVIFRPPQLVQGGMTKKYRLAEEGEVFRATTIRRSDVAHAMITALNKEEWSGKCFSISS